MSQGAQGGGDSSSRLGSRAQMTDYRDLIMVGEMGSDRAHTGLVGPDSAFSVMRPFGIFSSNQDPCMRGGRGEWEELKVESCISTLWSWQPLSVVQGKLLPFLS